jgi:CubicO group peptidase (beta-lactamase class C family)
MRARIVVLGILAMSALGILTYMLIPRLLGHRTAQVPAPTDSVKLTEGLHDLQEGALGINSLLIVRNGFIVLDAYIDPYDGSFPHKLASVTKSVTTTLIGIAIDQGKLQLDQKMVSFFPDRTIANLDDQKKSITVQHLVEMMNGMESGCLAGDEPTLNAMRATSDWVQAALDRKMAQKPGTRFCYDSPGMHILSAILQKATGMTELEFARQNLFAPLGIQEVFWQADPQGYTHGWGDLYLKPRDSAKIGYLWLNHGRWEDRQVVSARWLTDAVKPHSSAGDDDYGYGMWISRSAPPSDNYFAVGRGGQYIRVYPSFNAIIVVTAQGLGDYDQLNPLLASAFVSPEKALPANADGVARLNGLLPELARSPQAYPTAGLPDTAQRVSGKVMTFGSNPLNVKTLRLEFKGTAEATLNILTQPDTKEIWRIGLDGKYRLSPGGQAIRGYWSDPQTFVVTVFEDGVVNYHFQFDSDRVEVSSPELGLKLEGEIGPP